MTLSEATKIMSEKIINVETSSNISYPVIISEESIELTIKKIYSYTKAKKVLLVADEKVNKIYLKNFQDEKIIKFILKSGENQKNLKNYKKIVDFALKNKIERTDCIVALGGGVTGDLAGFVASTYLRGIDFIQIPTTLLAFVDSSVGGKVAVNLKQGKNLLGSFYQPKAVLCNPVFVQTLSDREFKSGLAEVLKYSFIEKSAQSETDFYNFLNENHQKILSRDSEILSHIIFTSVSIKASVVKIDEKEAGLRKILNFGHTIGHAIEKITKYKKFTHGEAICIGMLYAFELAYEKNQISETYKNKMIDLINKFSIIQKFPKFNFQKIYEAIKADKKVKDGKINFVLPSNEFFVESVEMDIKTICFLCCLSN